MMPSEFHPSGGPPSSDDVAADLTVTIVEAVADAKGVSSLALDEPLYDAVDPDLLADFVLRFGATSPADSTVTFEFAGCQVCLHATGVVFVQHESAANPVVRSVGDDSCAQVASVPGDDDSNDHCGGSPQSDV